MTKLLPLIFAGVLDAYPGVQLIVNHWGEVFLLYAERIAMIDHLGTRLARYFEDYLRDNVTYTSSGIMSQRYLRWTKEIVGVERISDAGDFPTSTPGRAEAAHSSTRTPT